MYNAATRLRILRYIFIKLQMHIVWQNYGITSKLKHIRRQKVRTVQYIFSFAILISQILVYLTGLYWLRYALQYTRFTIYICMSRRLYSKSVIGRNRIFSSSYLQLVDSTFIKKIYHAICRHLKLTFNCCFLCSNHCVDQLIPIVP